MYQLMLFDTSVLHCSTHMKVLRAGVIVVILSIILCSCRLSKKMTSSNPEICIGEYIFCVEEAKGDQHNVRIVYSLSRQDGENIDPEVRFERLVTDDFSRSASSGIEYRPSKDGKKVWIVEEQSSAQKYDCDTLYTVKLKNLILGGDSNYKTIEGSWEVPYRMQIDEEYIEALDEKVKILFAEGDSYYCELKSIQISSMGIHIEMTVPHYDVTKLSQRLTCTLVFEDGEVLELTERRHSVRSRKWSNVYNAYCEKLFDEQINLDDVYSIVVCGQEICVNQ